MDQTPMQQTVMESPQETSPPKEVDMSTLSISTSAEPEETTNTTTSELQVTENQAPAPAATTDESKQAFERLEIPKQFHQSICGTNNEKINTLMKENDIHIIVPPISDMKNEMTISGEVEGVNRAKKTIMVSYKNMERKFGTACVEIKKSQHKSVIGLEILSATGVLVEIPNTDSSSETITLRGPQDKLGGALMMVYAKASCVV